MPRFEHPPTVRGYNAYECVSALQKAVRRSQVEEAIYWAVELHLSGHAGWVWNRLKTICVEDIGPADRTIHAQVHALEEWSKSAKDGGGRMELVTAVTLMATASKSRLACWALIRAGSDHHERLEIPDEALDSHTRRGRQMKRGADFFYEHSQVLIDPDEAAQSRGFENMQKELEDIELRAEGHGKMRDAGRKKELPYNPISKVGKDAKPKVGKVTANSEGGVGVHQLPGMGKK
jgi:replication-associated recombination protein RarA